MTATRTIYLDNNATTAIAPEVFEVMVPFLTENYGNPSSSYSLAKTASEAVRKARQQVADLLHCDAKEILFTSCGSESDNTAIGSALQTSGKKHIVTTQVEHSAVHKQCEYLEQKGYSVTWLPVAADGTLELSEVEEAIHDGTAIVSIMWANNETGVLFPIQEIGELCRKRGVLFHTDAVQTPGKILLDLQKTPVDFLALSGHKLHAPKGIGVLYVRQAIRFQPYLIGGGQERSRRAGTENVPYIVGLGRAAELAAENLAQEQTRVRRMRDHFERELLAVIPRMSVNGHPTHRLPNTSNLCLEGIRGEKLLDFLNEQGICASSGSACTTGSHHPSHVLSAMGLNADQARASLRFSFGINNSDEEVQTVLKLIPTLVGQLRDGINDSTAAIR